MGKCKHCGVPLDATGKRHENGTLFCAFAKAPIDWYDNHTATAEDGHSGQ